MTPRRVVVISMEPDDKDRFPCLVDGHVLQLSVEDVKRYAASGAVCTSA